MDITDRRALRNKISGVPVNVLLVLFTEERAMSAKQIHADLRGSDGYQGGLALGTVNAALTLLLAVRLVYRENYRAWRVARELAGQLLLFGGAESSPSELSAFSESSPSELSRNHGYTKARPASFQPHKEEEENKDDKAHTPEILKLTAWHTQEIGEVTPMIQNMLVEWWHRFPVLAKWEYGFEAAASHNKRVTKYVIKCVKDYDNFRQKLLRETRGL